MSAVALGEGTLDAQRETRCNATRHGMLLTLMLCAVRASAALAGDQPLPTDHTFAHEARMFPHNEAGAEFNYSAPFAALKPSSEPQEFSATEFRPRKPNVLELDSDRGRGSLLDAPMLKSTSIWQQMREFKSQDRVRLLTLWQTRGSSLSLQAGKRGSPSLQWSTPWVHREGASRGLFDRLLPEPQHASSGNSRAGTPHATMSSTSRSLDLGPAAIEKR
jgi:hypothetical protein